MMWCWGKSCCPADSSSGACVVRTFLSNCTKDKHHISINPTHLFIIPFAFPANWRWLRGVEEVGVGGAAIWLTAGAKRVGVWDINNIIVCKNGASLSVHWPFLPLILFPAIPRGSNCVARLRWMELLSGPQQQWCVYVSGWDGALTLKKQAHLVNSTHSPFSYSRCAPWNISRIEVGRGGSAGVGGAAVALTAAAEP